MTIEAIRFRTDEGKVVLQVLVRPERSRLYSGYEQDLGEWRDAKVEDLLQVAAYTRAHDSIDRQLSDAIGLISTLQSQVERVIEQNERMRG